MGKKLLTLEDLYNYYSTKKKSCNFSSKDDDSVIVVQIPGQARFDSTESEIDKDKEGLMPVELQACHVGKNLNKSNIEMSSMESALPSFSNRPILGYIHEVEDEDGNKIPHFYGHNMHIEDDEMVYDEAPVGIIPESCNARIEYDEDKKKDYVVVNGYIFEQYSKAAEILEREQECSVSVELSIRKMSYDAKEKVLNLEDFFFSGVTILGVDSDGDEVKPGMSGSNIKLADFSKKKNGIIQNNNVQNKLIETLEKLNSTISNFNIDKNLKEGGNQVLNFEELLEKYGVSKEDVTFEYENLSESELEEKFEEVFGKKGSTSSDKTFDGDGEGTESNEDDSSETDGESSGTNEEETDGETGDEPNGDEESDEDEDDSDEEDDDFVPSTDEDSTVKKKKKFSEDGSVSITFEISHEDIRSSLNVLLGQYDEEDNEWYWIDYVYDDYFVFSNWRRDKIYGQKYSIQEDNVSFVDERWQLFEELLTESEKNALDEMRSNYSEIKSKLSKYESEPEKVEILNSKEYNSVASTKEFEELLKQENHFDLSVEETREKADSILLKYAKSGELNFSSIGGKKPESGFMKFGKTKNKSKKGRYGNLFNKE